MSFRVERRFNLLILEEGEEYIADVSATMALRRKSHEAESKGRLRIGSKSLVFQPDEVSASIIKFPFRATRKIDGVNGSITGATGTGATGAGGSLTAECEQFVQVTTMTHSGLQTRIAKPFSIMKSKVSVTFHVHYASVTEYLQIIKRLWEAAPLGMAEAEVVVRGILAEVTASVQFDTSRLGHRESALLPSHLWVRRVKPLLMVRGMLQISDEAIYFQPHPNFSSTPVKRVPHADVLHVFRRTYGVQANALEIITVRDSALYLDFEAQGDRDHVARILQEQRQRVAVSGPSRPTVPAVPRPGVLPSSPCDSEDVLHDIRRMTALWQSGVLSNFHYIDFLNCAGGRSQNDFSQYPVFPWVLRDYTSESLCLGDPSVYRDLNKPIGAINAKRLAYFKERMDGLPEEERFLYGTHYSTPAYVIYWLLREMPERMLRLHNGHFDAWPRLFRSVPESWESVNESTASLMELIPEFFVLPATWLENALGIVTAEGPLNDVQLPRWATGISDFIVKMRAALESEWVSRNLPAWIDLIFGYKQVGEEAVKADNLFHPVCYTGSKGQPPSSSSLPIAVLETQLQEFGRVPRQLFEEAHPPRLRIPRWKPERLQEDPVQSEPWYKAVQSMSAGAMDSAEALDAAAMSTNEASPAAASTFAPPDRGSAQVVALPRLGGGIGGHAKATPASMRALRPRAAAPFAASGRIAGVASCASNVYAIGEDGCLRVSPLSLWCESGSGEGAVSSSATGSTRRNFRVSPMPLSALAVVRRDLLAIGGHDNAVTLYSSSCGSALAKSHVHADTVSCISVSPCRSNLVTGSRDQSVRTWAFTPASLKNDATFDDAQQPITCVATAGSLILAGGSEGQLMAWDRRSGQCALERELDAPVAACALHQAENLATALDEAGELRLWDLRRGCESLRLSVVASGGGSSLADAYTFLTDSAGWAVVAGANSAGHPAVTLWDFPEQREIFSWQLEADGGNPSEVQFLMPVRIPGSSPEDREDASPAGAFLSATASGMVHVFAPAGAS